MVLTYARRLMPKIGLTLALLACCMTACDPELEPVDSDRSSPPAVLLVEQRSVGSTCAPMDEVWRDDDGEPGYLFACRGASTVPDLGACSPFRRATARGEEGTESLCRSNACAAYETGDDRCGTSRAMACPAKSSVTPPGICRRAGDWAFNATEGPLYCCD